MYFFVYVQQPTEIIEVFYIYIYIYIYICTYIHKFGISILCTHRGKSFWVNDTVSILFRLI